MKAIDLLRFLQQQRDEHAKVIFTTSELANAAGGNPRSLNVALDRYVTSGVIARYTPGRYGLPGEVSPEDLVPAIDTSAYITGQYGLYRRQMITQMPAEITCFTNRRHNRSRTRETPVGRIVFVCVTGSTYAPPKDSVVVPAEQALIDFVYICRRRGVSQNDVVTFRNLDRLNGPLLDEHLSRYPKAVQRDVRGMF